MTQAELLSMGLTPESLLYVYSWGFGSVLSAYAFGYVVGLVKALISKM